MTTSDLRANPAAPPKESPSFLRWILVAVGLLIGGVAVTALVRALPKEANEEGIPIPTIPKGPPGKVVLTEITTHKFGVMAQQEKGSHTWTFKNDGPGDLELTKGPATCSCTIANFKDEKSSLTLKAGEETNITLDWETREFDGKFEKSATINVYGDPDRDRVQFVIEGVVRPAVAVAPDGRALSFGTIPNDAPAKSKFAIASGDKPDLKILSITSSRPDALSFSPVPLADEDRKGLGWEATPGGYTVWIDMKPSRSLGEFFEVVTVKTDHPKAKDIEIRLSGKRVGPISLTPDAVRLHGVDPALGAATALIVVVRNAPQTEFTVTGAPEGLKVEVVPSDVRVGTAAKVRQYRIVVTVPADMPSEEIKGAITLATNHPQVERITIPVDITVIGAN